MVDKQCFECGAPVLDPWVSTSYAIVLCINCAGRHRALGTHNSFVKSWTRDVWSEELKRVVKCGGNDAALEYFNHAGISDLPIEKRYATREAHQYSAELFAKAEVDLPAGLQRIEGAVFNSIAVEEIEIPETVTYIGRSAFIGCDNLTEIVIPDSVTEIGYRAFQNCERLEKITMSNKIEKMGFEVFDDTAWYNAQPDGFVMLGDILYRLKGDGIREVTSLPEGTKYLAGGVFYKCQQLERVDLSGELGLTWLGEDMFYMCTGMKEIVFPADLTELLPGTIAQCGRLEEIVIPGSVKRIADFAMERAGMAALRGTGTFRGIFYGGTQEEWNAIEIEESAEVLDEEKYVRYYYSESEPETNAEWRKWSEEYGFSYNDYGINLSDDFTAVYFYKKDFTKWNELIDWISNFRSYRKKKLAENKK